MSSSTLHVISFKASEKEDMEPGVYDPGDDLSQLSDVYNKNRLESYYEQCFEQISKIGEGSFGEVFKVRSRDDGQLYAVKISKSSFRNEAYRQVSGFNFIIIFLKIMYIFVLPMWVWERNLYLLIYRTIFSYKLIYLLGTYRRS